MPAAGTSASGNASFEIKQSLYKDNHPAIHVTTLHERDITRQLLDDFSNNSFIGLAGEYKAGQLVQLALATRQEALLVRIASPTKSKKGLKRTLLEEVIFSNPKVQKIAFNLDRLALALHSDIDLNIENGVDMLSLLGMGEDRTSLNAVIPVLGDKMMLHMPKVADIFRNEKEISTRKDRPVLRAWSACHVAHLGCWVRRIASVARIDTSRLEKEVSHRYI
jgi:hypothetical protein